MELADPDALAPGLSRKAALILFEIAKRRGFYGVRADAPASHPQAQRNAAELPGSAPCAVLAGRAAHPEEKAGVITIASYCPIARTAATVHLPARHADMAKAIYASLGLSRTVKTGADAPIPAKSLVECAAGDGAGTSVLSVRAIGMDCVERLHALLNAERGKGAEIVTAFLATDSPTAPEVAAWCEKVGLSFAGIVPGHFGGTDALVLQWVGVPLDANAVKIQDARVKKLFEYVRTCLGY
jgi:hypothetical protein